MNDEWRYVNSYTKKVYKCGLHAGDRLRLKMAFSCRDDSGKVTDQFEAGSSWTVLQGDQDDVVWLRNPLGDRHTWDDSVDIFQYFETI